MNISTDFDIGDKVQLTKDAIRMNAGNQIKNARVDEIIIDNNGVWYSVMHNISEGGMNFKSAKVRAFMIEKVPHD